MDSLAAGRQAFRRRRWEDAYEQLSAAADAETELDPSDLAALGDAAWVTSHFGDTFRAWERAYAGYLHRGDRQCAALLAITIANEALPRGELAVGAGWRKTAKRLLRDEPDCRAAGLVAWHDSQLALLADGDAEAALEFADEVVRIGSAIGDIDLEMLGVNQRARMLAKLGRTAEGVALLDEPMAVAVTGGMEPWSARIVFCHTLDVCSELGDLRRASQWADAAERSSAREAMTAVRGECLVHRAGILRLRGSWSQAEDAARGGCHALGDEPFHSGAALNEVGEIRLRRGDYAGAEEAFSQAHATGFHPAQPGLAMLRFAQGKPKVAAELLDEALAGDRVELSRARLLPARLEVALALGDSVSADAVTEELQEIAARFSTPALHAVAAQARGALALSMRHPRAVASLKDSVRLWREVGAPYEAARARELLAEALLEASDKDGALLELRAVLAVYEELGAKPDARRAHDAVRALEPQSAAPRREQRTFMFTDIVKSTELVAAIGDDAWTSLLAWHHTTLRGLFAEHQGEEIEDLGDGFFVAFEDEANALDCAVAVQRTLSEHRRRAGFAPQVRIGLHADEVTRRDERNFAGKGIHVAARIGALAGGGEILASRTTVAAAEPAIPTSDPRSETLKGVAEPVEVVTVDWS